MRTKLLLVFALLFAMSFPTIAAWSYFLALAGSSAGVNAKQQAAYVLGKIIQFAFPLFFLGAIKRGSLSAGSANKGAFSYLNWGLSFALIVVGLMLVLYFGFLRNSSLLAQTPAKLQHKLRELGMDTPARYVLLALFLVAAHSLLEECYWRWFVFGGLLQFLPFPPAMLLSSLAFMAHHVIVLLVFLPGQFWTAVLPFSLAVAVGGAVWAWLYDRSGRLWPPWLSHLLIDAGIFVIGWDLLWPIHV